MVSTMDVWWYQLVFAIVGCDGLAKCDTCLIVENVYVWCCMLCSQLVVDLLVGCDSVGVMLGLEGTNQNGIGFAVKGYHYVLVATARLRCEPTGVIRKQVVDEDELHFDCWCRVWRLWCVHGQLFC